MATAIDEKNLPKLREYLDSLNFTDKHAQLAGLIDKFDSVADIKQSLSVLKVLYEDFLYAYPFNHTYWTKYANFYIRIQQNETALEIYEEAVSLNPVSLELWNSYILFITQNYANDTEKVLEVYERALKSLQSDVNVQLIWEGYISFFETRDPQRTHFIYWRILDSPISQPTEISQRYEKFVSELDANNYQAFTQQRQDLSLPPDVLANKSSLVQFYSQKIKDAAVRNLPADSERRLQELFEKTEFDGDDVDQTKEGAFQNYLAKQEQLLNPDKLLFFYQKCLIVKCKSGEFWVKILHLLEKIPSAQNQVAEYFRKYSKHFSVIENKEPVFFFQADLLEASNNVEGCREVYKYLEQRKVFEAYLRHLYMEIRTNNIGNVVDIFVSLSESVNDGDQIAFVIQEMGEILNKLGEVDRAVEIIKQFNDKKTEYSKFFFISWINFLKNCKKPWEEIEAVFRLAFEKAKEADKNGLWKVYLYTARSYCNDINTLREIERRYIFKEDLVGTNENGINGKRPYEALEGSEDENYDKIRKQVKMT